MMLQSQRFALENIYCAPAQDRQYSFKMSRVNKQTFPAIRQVTLYGVTKPLPNTTSYFQVFTIGNLFPEFLNLQGQNNLWMRDQWVRMSDDMVARNFIAKVYNDAGMVFPRQHVYYSYIDENSLVIVLEMTSYIKQHFDTASYKYLNVYSNAYFQSAEYNQQLVRNGILYHTKAVGNNLEKAQLQTLAATLKGNGGDVFVYVDGVFVDQITLNIPDQSFVEIVYDQSVVSRERFNIQGLRTFDSVKDNKMKYLVYRTKVRDSIEYQDDAEVYITQKDTGMNQGLLLYRHQDYVMRNVTDKDYSLHTAFVNSTAQTLSQKVGGNLNDKVITLYVRKSGRDRPLVYNAMKLHELYKLPFEVQQDVLSNTNYTVDIYRAEQLENSAYFQCASAQGVNKITPEMAIDAIGYNGMTHYYADTPVVTNGALTIDVPELYQTEALAFEYDASGKYLRMMVSDGPLYTCTNDQVAMVDFMAGSLPVNYGALYAHDAVIVTDGLEYRVLSAYFDQTSRTSAWEDITDQPTKCQRTKDTLTITETEGKRIKLVCLSNPRVYDLEIPLTQGNLYFPLTQPEDRGNGVVSQVIDVPYETIEIYLNGSRLTQGLDFFLKFPYVSICTKRYLDYTLESQRVHVRMAGFTLDPEQINQQELRGFVNNGVLTRNRRYDIRDDRVLSVFVDGKLKDRRLVRYAENDNTVRINASANGRPYTLKEPFIALKRLTGVDSFPIYRKNIATNKKISDLYDLVNPEPPIDEFNVIDSAHYLFSPLVSSILADIKERVIPASFYTTPYDDTAILQLIDQNYKTLFALDPIRANLQETLVEIHPHLGNSAITLDLLQYRFVQNVIRVITGNKPAKINLSGYLTLST
jgi:hypothetical protein